MKVIVASENPVKRAASEVAFGKVFPSSRLDIRTVRVDSGVSEQPMSDGETRCGARQRAANAQKALPGANFSVGFEGGVETIDETLLAFAWVAVMGSADKLGEARTVTLPLPPAVRKLVDQGIELGEANDRVFATTDSKRHGGAFGLLTNGLYTRESVYTEALVVALVPFVNELYRDIGV